MHTYTPKHQIPRKRRQEETSTDNKVFDVLVKETSLQNYVSSNVVDSIKVKSYLSRLLSMEQEPDRACIKLVLSVSEVAGILLTKIDDCTEYFGLSSVHITPIEPLSIDRIVALHGNLDDIIRCTLYIAFILNSRVNNISKTQPFTLRSSNYHTTVLIEGSSEHALRKYLTNISEKCIDISQYERNLGLQLVALTGDFSTLFKSLSLLLKKFPYQRYGPEDSIRFIPLQSNHDVASASLKPLVNGVDDSILLKLLNFANK